LRKFRTVILLPLLFLLAACVGNRASSKPPDGYVEIENPAFTMAKDAPATIWVPQPSAENGVPRGGDLLNKGYEAAKQEATGNAPKQLGGNYSTLRVATGGAVALKSRIAALEIGQNGLLLPFHEKVKNASIGILLDPDTIADSGAASRQADRLSLAIRLYQEFSANLAIFIMVPDQIAPGKRLVAEIHDGMGGGMLREVSAIIPSFAADQSAEAKAVASALASVAEKIKEFVVLIPWYGRVVAIDREKVYINAGKETGMTVGKKLKIIRGGKFIEGLGFAPGEMVATIEIQGFVGTNGAYGLVKERQRVLIGDLVAAE